MAGIKQKVFSGLTWNAIQGIANKGISFLFLIVMARLLVPSDYGTIGLLAVFIAIADAFINCGFGQALVRKQDRTALDESTVFYFNIVASCICYLGIFLLSPWVADFYNMPILCGLLRFLALRIIISSLSAVQTLKYTILLEFKTPTIIKIVSNVVSGIIGIVFAYFDYGAWALAIQQVLFSVFSTLLYWMVSKWRPIWGFSWPSFKYMFSFGSKILGANLLNIFYANLSAIFIGKVYSSSDLGLYSKGQEMASYPSDILYGILSAVSYPLLCTLQSDKQQLTMVYRKIIRLSSFVIFPVMALVCALSSSIILLLFGEKWCESAIYLSLLCYPFMIVPICGANFSLLQVVGRSDLVLKLEVITKIIGTITLLITLPISIKAMCYGVIINVSVALLIDTYYTSRFVDLTYFRQLLDVLKPMLISFTAGFIVYSLNWFELTPLTRIIIGIPFGATLYFLFNFILGKKDLVDIIRFVKSRK